MTKIIKKLTDLKGKIKKYKKKPIIVRAVRIEKNIVVETREGKLIACKGDYLIEGIKGEIYPCNKEIFNKTYEKVN